MLIIVALITYGCSISIDYSIKKKFLSVVDNENCKISFFYPEFSSIRSNIDVEPLNEMFEKGTDIELHYLNQCNTEQQQKMIIKGDYKVTLKTSDILSIEFTTVTEEEKYGIDTVYFSFVIDPKKVGKKDISYFKTDPKSLIPNFDRGDLYKYVKKYNEEKKKNVNLLAYETGSNIGIHWGISKKNFLLYVGGEGGEGFGNGKIKIPLDELKN